jgi:hypothetical protein
VHGLNFKKKWIFVKSACKIHEQKMAKLLLLCQEDRRGEYWLQDALMY